METHIKKFGRQEITFIREEIQAALDVIKNKYSLTELILGTISFNESSFNAKIIAALPEHKIVAESYAIEEVKFFAYQNELPQDILQKTFISNGNTHQIIRIETRNPKYPIITKCSNDGKTYKFSVQIVKEILERTK
ncbi:MAG: hypothetical protein ABIT08_06490 [Bacteroidia bacterium]